MTSANNLDLLGKVARIFNPPASYGQILQDLAAKDPDVCAIVEAAIEVHTTLGHGFLVPVYCQALAVELSARSVAFEPKAQITLNYKDHLLNTGYEADFICYGDMLVLATAAAQLERTHDRQLVSHLKCTGLRRGLYLNFGVERVDFHRAMAPRREGPA
ncbi:MAG: GxxExxY protein [Candidatus Hydrogenedentes bacterium]|nr:GxxExxY protein [Candidatus Hydrogenedentota bacterium]